MNELKNAYEKIEVNEELKERSLERLLENCSTAAKVERPAKSTSGMKKSIAIAAAAAAALAMTVSAGAVISGTFHKETVEEYLGSGAADELQKIEETKGKVITTANSVENGYFRITIDAVLSDGDRAVIYATKERLTDDKFGIEEREPGLEDDWITPFVSIEGGHARSWETYGFNSNGALTLPEDGITKEKYVIYGIDPNKKLTLDYKDDNIFLNMMDSLDKEAREAVYKREDYNEYHYDYIHPYYVQGLKLTVDVSNNFNAAEFKDESGNTVSVTPYSIYVKDPELGEKIGNKQYPFEIKAIGADGTQTVSCTDCSEDWDAEAQKSRGKYFGLSGLIKNIDKVQRIEISGIGEFTKQ